MNIVGVKELKSQLTQYLGRTKKGEEVVVTEHGTPIAILRPIEEALPSTSLEARLTDLAEKGKLRLPRKKFLGTIPHIKILGEPVSSTILKERR